MTGLGFFYFIFIKKWLTKLPSKYHFVFAVNMNPINFTNC